MACVAEAIANIAFTMFSDVGKYVISYQIRRVSIYRVAYLTYCETKVNTLIGDDELLIVYVMLLVK